MTSQLFTALRNKATNSLQIITIGHQTLRKNATPVSTEEILSSEMQKLVSQMTTALTKNHAIGLAAPQVNVSKQLLVVHMPFNPTTSLIHNPLPLTILFNPTIQILHEKEKIKQWESCLSVPGLFGKVTRHKHIVITYLDEHARKKKISATGVIAGMLQHESDHLSGVIYLDRMKRDELQNNLMHIENLEEYWKRTGDTGDIEGHWKFLE